MTSGRKQTLTIRGVTYPSITAASKALGITKQAIASAKERGTLEFVGLGRKPLGGTNRKSVYVGEQKFETVTEAAEFLGISASRLSSYIHVQRILDQLNLSITQPKRKPKE